MNRRRRRVRLTAVVLAVACLLALVAGGWVSGRAWQARTHLVAAAELARQLQQELEAGQAEQAERTLASLQEHTRAARSAAADPGWRIGRRLPGPGANLAAVGEVAVAMDDLAQQGLPPLVEVGSDLDPAALAPSRGRIDLAPVQRAAPRITAADRAVRAARDRVAAISTDHLLPPLRSAITELRSDLDRAAATIGATARAAALMPSMLGADGVRTYLVLFQNPAEVRATGGMPGAFAVVEADRGALRIIRQGTAGADLKAFEEPVLPLDPALRGLYTDRLGTYPANVNLTPHFPTAAALAREMYRLRYGEEVDGVLATDPIALSYLLRATGPVDLPEGPALTAETAVRVLLSDVYVQLSSNEDQDAYFATAAVAAFDALVDGRAEPRAALDELAVAAGERRILLWSVHPAEQELIAGTVLAGELPTEDGQRPVVGVFLNDGSGAKLGYYLSQAAEVAVEGRRPDGRHELRLRFELGSTAPRTGLPPAVLGLGLAGDPYTIRTNVSIFSPAKGALVAVRLDGEPAPVGTGIERNRTVGVLTVDVPPGVTRTVEATLLTGVLPEPGAVTAELWLTPTVTP